MHKGEENLDMGVSPRRFGGVKDGDSEVDVVWLNMILDSSYLAGSVC